MKQTKILTSTHLSSLNTLVEQHQEQGWETVGAAQVVTLIEQCQYAGNQLMRTLHSHEFFITVIKY